MAGKRKSEETVEASGDSRLHPRLRTMLNMHTGPLTLLAESQATVRIPESVISDQELKDRYPKARTLADPRSGAHSAVHLVTPHQLERIQAELPKVKKRKADPDTKELGDAPKMRDELPKAEFSVFVKVDPSAHPTLNSPTKDSTADSTKGSTKDATSGSYDMDPGIIGSVESLAAHETWVSRRSDLFSMSLTAEGLVQLAGTAGVAAVESGETVRKLPVVTNAVAKAPGTSIRRVANSGVHNHGANVIVGIIDVEGFDFAHEDFLDADTGETRFLAIWDQAGTTAAGFRDAPQQTRPSAYRMGYGSEILKSQMDAALRAAPELQTAATQLEPQTSMIPGSHATHVASIAAGNRGVCRRAGIVGVSLALADGDSDRRRSFYDTSRLAHAVDYILEFAEHHALLTGEPVPVSINISLGTNGHSHDGSAVISRWIDYAVATPGRSVTVAAGNAGATQPDPAGGIGHLLGRVHAQGRIEGRELSQELEWEVFGNGVADISMNEMEIWYPAQDRISVQLTAPDGRVLPVVSAGEQIINHARPDKTRISIYNDRYHPVNGFNRISIYLEPFLASNNGGMTAVVGVPAGIWTVQLIGDEIRDGTWHAWIERDDPVVIGDHGGVTVAQFPSAFAHGTFDPTMQVSTLACGAYVNSVANLDEDNRMIHPSSSRGPTRTGEPKPDIAAAGTDIVAANGFSSDKWVSMTGTSMAAPYVTGVVGLMLAVDHGLTATQITSILRRTARPLPGHTFDWQQDAGYGAIDRDRAIEETLQFAPTRQDEAARERAAERRQQ